MKKNTQEIRTLTDNLQSNKCITETPQWLGTDFSFVFLFSVLIQWNRICPLNKSSVSYLPLKTNKNKKHTLFGSYIRFSFQNTVFATLKSVINVLLAFEGPQLWFHLVCGVCQVVGFVVFSCRRCEPLTLICHLIKVKMLSSSFHILKKKCTDFYVWKKVRPQHRSIERLQNTP